VDDERTRTSFPLIRSHVLLQQSGDLARADHECAALLAGDVIRDVVATVPDSLLVDPAAGASDFSTGAEARERYERYLVTRLSGPRTFLHVAIAAQQQVRLEPPLHLKARR
jgi:hypothetical protein